MFSNVESIIWNQKIRILKKLELLTYTVYLTILNVSPTNSQQKRRTTMVMSVLFFSSLRLLGTFSPIKKHETLKRKLFSFFLLHDIVVFFSW